MCKKGLGGGGDATAEDLLSSRCYPLPRALKRMQIAARKLEISGDGYPCIDNKPSERQVIRTCGYDVMPRKLITLE